MNKLLAPNGKKSNLTPEQYKLVRTKAFKDWFGDWENEPESSSKVIDENGEPLVCYHGTPTFSYGYDKNGKWKQTKNERFYEFDKLKNRFSHSKIGFYFSEFETAKEYADNNGNIYQVFLKVLNPKVNNDGIYFDIESKTIVSNRISDEDYKLLLKNNIDGLISFYKYGLEKRLNEIVVFEPTQIKLADGTNTTFSIGSPDIRFADGGLVIGNTYTGKKVKDYLRKASFKDTDFFEYIKDTNKYYLKEVYVDTLLNKDSALSTFISQSQGEFEKDSSNWHNEYPIVIGDDKWEKGVVIDGYHRIAQAIQNGDSTLLAFVKINKSKYSDGGMIESLIEQGVVDLKMYDTKPEHAEIYGLESSNPLYVQRIYIVDKERNKGVEENIFEYIDEYAKVNNHDLIFGHIEEKSESNLKAIKSMLEKAGYTTIEGNNDFYKYVETKKQFAKGGRTVAQTPAPAKDRIYGSKVNKKDSASSESRASSIKLSESIISVLEDKMREHNSEYPNKKVTLAVLKAVFRRGAGAYSSSHRPTISGGKPNSRTAWAYARVNRFLEKKAGKQVKKAYVQDDDLIGKYAKGGEVGGSTKFMKWWLEWYKPISDKMSIYISFPIDSTKFAESNVVILDLFEKIDQEIDAKPYLNEIVRKADEYGTTIYLNPTPRYKQFSKDSSKGRKVTKSYLIEYYKRFGFKLTNEDFMKRLPSKKYHLGGDMSKHLAPNGKPSNLTHEQWHLVRTPEFKAWFGDWENDPENASKVVDENGEPMVVYHGSKSTEDFNVFKQKSRFEFIYFAKTKEYSKYHFTKDVVGKPFQLKPFFLNIKNLLNAEEFGFDKIQFNELKSFFYGIYDLEKDIQLNPKREYRFWEVIRFSNDIFNSLKKEGYYNGISFYENFYEDTTWKDTDDYTLTYVVLNPNQIKLADGTNTTFDGSSPDIRFADGGYLDKDQFVSKALLFSPQYWRRRVPFLKAFDVYGNYENMETLYFKLFEPQYDVTTIVNDKFFSFKLSPKYILEVEEMKDDKVSITLFPKYVMRDFDMPYDRIEEEIEHFEIQFINAFRKTEQELSLNFELHPTKRDMDAIIDKIDKYFFEMIDFSDEIGFGVMFEKGGLIDPEKAKQILEDGKIRGRKLTDKQRRFFWASALRKMANGNLLDTKIEDSPLRGKSLKDVSDLSEIYTLAEKYKVGTGEIRKEFFKGIEVEREHTGDYGLSAQIALNHLNEDKDYYTKLQTLKLEKGGELKAENNEKEIIHNSGSAGGVLVGRRHSEGGIKAINRSTGQPLEMEGGEVVITRNAVSDNQKYEFEGEMLTNRQILSRINVSGGGVSFEDGGEIDECGCSGHKYNYGGEVLEDYEIVKRMAKGGKTKRVLGNPAFHESGKQFLWSELVEDFRNYGKETVAFFEKWERLGVIEEDRTLFTPQFLKNYILAYLISGDKQYELPDYVFRTYCSPELIHYVVSDDDFKFKAIEWLNKGYFDGEVKRIIKADIPYNMVEFLNDVKEFTSKDQLRPRLTQINTAKGIGSENFTFYASDGRRFIHYPNVNVPDELDAIIEDNEHTVYPIKAKINKPKEISDYERSWEKQQDFDYIFKNKEYISSGVLSVLELYSFLYKLSFFNDKFTKICGTEVFYLNLDFSKEKNANFSTSQLLDVVTFLYKYMPNSTTYSFKFRVAKFSTPICYINYAQNNFTQVDDYVFDKLISQDYFGLSMPFTLQEESSPDKPTCVFNYSDFFYMPRTESSEESPKEQPKEEIPNANITNQEVQEQIDALMLVIQYSDKEDEISEAQDLIDALKLLLD